ncbi:hypothetical protein CMP1-56 [Clavibacter phage CMP1]|uniref:Uncharacterized protein n=1 Tax=Clavibacter phage CMP1 TaxID=686439 RepID=D0U240_9CAUD|nr:hypothetical protein CMP1-56 [Clavibacter phage CMP1]ACY35950.1 hypothetical protein CMP1-56 [Clavibacter phage CMP1]
MKSTRSLLSAKIVGIKVATESSEQGGAVAPSQAGLLNNLHPKASLSWINVSVTDAMSVIRAFPIGWYVPDYAKERTGYSARRLTFQNDSVFEDVYMEILMDRPELAEELEPLMEMIEHE